MRLQTKDQEATLALTIDWSEDWADGQTLGDGETIDTSDWTVPEGLTVIGEPANTDTAASIRLGDGLANNNYKLYNKITTSAGNIYRRAIGVQVRDAATFDEPGDAEQALAAVRAVMQGAATKNQKSYSIAGRQLQRYEMTELIALESRLITQVNQDRMTKALRNGVPILKNVHTRFR